jgi:hypothetical protein
MVEDPLVEVARQLRTLRERYDGLDLLIAEGRSTRMAHLDHELADLADRMDSLEAYAATLEARSVAGALLQLALASNLYEDLDGGVTDAARQQQMLIRHRRLAFSAARALLHWVDVSDDLGITRLMDVHLDPWDSREDTGGRVEPRRQPEDTEREAA